METTTPAEGNMETKDLTHKYFEAWERRDADAIAALHTDDTVYQVHSAGQEPARGREAVRAAFAALFEQFPDIVFEVVSLHLSHDFWAVEWKVRTALFEADLADVVTVENGLVKSKQSYLDALSVQAQLEGAAAGTPDGADPTTTASSSGQAAA